MLDAGPEDYLLLELYLAGIRGERIARQLAHILGELGNSNRVEVNPLTRSAAA